MSPSFLRPPDDLDGVRARIPAVAVRIALAVVGSLLSLDVFGLGLGLGGWLVIGILLSAAAAYWPQYLLGWALILFLAAGQLAHHATLSGRLLLLLAGLHLLHVLATLTLELPAFSWLAPAVFKGPLSRWLAIQLPSQAVAVLVLSLLAPRAGGHRPVSVPVLALFGALALVGLAYLLLGPGLAEES